MASPFFWPLAVSNIDNMQGGVMRRWPWITLLLVLGYLAVAFYAVSQFRNLLISDGVSYIQVARYYAKGNLDLAVNSWWSPLFSWMLVPFVWMGAEPVLTAKILSVFLGLGFALGVRRFVREVLGGPYLLPAFAGALLLALPMVLAVGADLLLACLLTWYFAWSVRLIRQDFHTGAFLTGVLGGLAFLAKAYALPFVLVHLAMTFLLRWALVRRQLVVGKVWSPFLAAYFGLLIAVAPWIVTVSIHDKKWLISSPASYDRLLCPVTPEATPKVIPPWVLQWPREGRLTTWENPPEATGWPKIWSPWDSAEAMKCQVVSLAYNIKDVFDEVRTSDLFGLQAAGFLAGCWLLVRRPRSILGGMGTFCLWACVSIVIYFLGYSLIVIKVRFLWAMWGMLLALFLAGLWTLRGGKTPSWRAMAEHAALPAITPTASVTWLTQALTVVLLLSLGLNAIKTLKEGQNPAGLAAEATWIRESAAEFDFGNPIAANYDGRYQAMYVAYWENRIFLGASPAESAEAMARDLAPFGRTTLLIFNDKFLADSLGAHPAFRSLGRSSGVNNTRFLWVFEYTLDPVPVLSVSTANRNQTVERPR